MAPRANWKGYLRLSLVSCPIALYPASSLSEKVSFNRINRKTGNRLQQQNVDSESGEVVSREDMVRGYEVAKSQYMIVEDEEIEAVQIESTRTIAEIIRSVKEVRRWLPEADLSNLRLHSANHYGIEVEQPEGRTDKRGQFVLPVSRPDENADALFEQAQAAEESGNIAEAERLYRVLMKCDPTDAAAPFNLGNMLRANGRTVEAEAALRAATRADPIFAEAWYNLSDLLDEQGRSEAAIDCLRRALHAAPDYVDAIFNLALLLQRNNKHAEAADYWRRYLASDAQSEWAARARRSLKFCEMQIHHQRSEAG